MPEEQINLNIVEGDPFFAHEVSINFTPTQVVLDFKCITPRVDPRSKARPSFQMKHNVIMLEPWHAKAILDVMENTIKKFEEQYGKIQKPKSVIAAEKKQKAQQKHPAEHAGTTAAPSYLG